MQITRRCSACKKDTDVIYDRQFGPHKGMTFALCQNPACDQSHFVTEPFTEEEQTWLVMRGFTRY